MNRPVPNLESDHDIVRGNKDGVVTISKGITSVPRPHADGCVGCRREGVCVVCARPADFSDGRCVSGACARCCAAVHSPHAVAFRVVIHASPCDCPICARLRIVKAA